MASLKHSSFVLEFQVLSTKALNFTSQSPQPQLFEQAFNVTFTFPQPMAAKLLKYHTGLLKQTLLKLQNQCGLLNESPFCHWPSLN